MVNGVYRETTRVPRYTDDFAALLKYRGQRLTAEDSERRGNIGRCRSTEGTRR